MKTSVFLRKAIPEDAELLFSWANDIDVRKNAFQQHEITWDEHINWFKKKLQDESCYIYIADADMTQSSENSHTAGRPVGQIRLDVECGVAEIDYSVAAELRGRGYGAMMLAQVQRIADAGIRKFFARVKKSNPASVRVFEKCGFTKTADKEAFVEFEKERVQEPDGQKPAVVVCTQKSWNIEFAESLKARYGDKYDISVMTEKAELTAQALEQIKPVYVFLPHWSYIIPESVFGTYTCVVFHMTDLPYGRGGSPLQNLIVRGHTHTKLSAIHVDKGLDTGDVYMKEELELSGTADEILRRASQIIFSKMIPYILEHHPAATPQSGQAVVFRRRKPEDGRLLPEMDEKTIYDYIRMLDGEGYPNAFLEMGGYTLRFSGASYTDGKVTAKVTFEKKG